MLGPLPRGPRIETSLCYVFFSFTSFCSMLCTRPKISHEKELSPVQQQQSGAVEVCWAHYPEVRASKPRSAIFSFLLPIFICALTRPKISHEKELSPIQQQQSGAVEACWAHNQEVRGSKPRTAMFSFLLPIFICAIYKTKNKS